MRPHAKQLGKALCPEHCTTSPVGIQSTQPQVSLTFSKGISMHIEVSTDNTIDGSEALTNLITDLVQQELAHLDGHITRIEVHLSDPSTGTTGPEEKHCMLEARLKGHQPTVVKHAALTLEQATKGAARKMKSSLESALGKLSDRH